jgi:hypothetical protein
MPLFDEPAPSETPAVAVSSHPAQYFRDAIRIARFHDDTISRVSKDPRALVYGAGILAVGGLLTNASDLLSTDGITDDLQAQWLYLAVMLPSAAALSLLLSAFNIALMHGAAKIIFGATGSYVGMLRVLWLGSLVIWLMIIPVVGFIAGFWFLLIVLVSFEVVDGIERLQAMVVVAAYAGISFFLRIILSRLLQ